MNLLVDFNRRLGDLESFENPSPSINDTELFPPIKKGDKVIINSSKRSYLMKSQFVVPPPSIRIVLIFSEKVF